MTPTGSRRGPDEKGEESSEAGRGRRGKCVYIYIYIYIERERDREKGGKQLNTKEWF